jgi:hypothetical protein
LKVFEYLNVWNRSKFLFFLKNTKTLRLNSLVKECALVVFIALTSANKNQQPTFNMDLNIGSPVSQVATLSTKPPHAVVKCICVGQISLEPDGRDHFLSMEPTPMTNQFMIWDHIPPTGHAATSLDLLNVHMLKDPTPTPSPPLPKTHDRPF